MTSRVAVSHPEKKGSKPSPSIFFFFFFFFNRSILLVEHIFLMAPFNGPVTPPIYCIVTVKECMAE